MLLLAEVPLTSASFCTLVSECATLLFTGTKQPTAGTVCLLSWHRPQVVSQCPEALATPGEVHHLAAFFSARLADWCLPPAPDRSSLYIQKGLACHAYANTGALTACADGTPGVRHLSSGSTHRPDLQMCCLHHLQGAVKKASEGRKAMGQGLLRSRNIANAVNTKELLQKGVRPAGRA